VARNSNGSVTDLALPGPAFGVCVFAIPFVETRSAGRCNGRLYYLFFRVRRGDRLRGSRDGRSVFASFFIRSGRLSSARGLTGASPPGIFAPGTRLPFRWFLSTSDIPYDVSL